MMPGRSGATASLSDRCRSSIPTRRRSAERKQEKIREAKARRSIGYTYPEAHHYAERSTVERVNGRLKDEFGARHLRVRGHAKSFCHLMYGVLALTVSQLMKLQI